jgi:hypothetical protein
MHLEELLQNLRKQQLLKLTKHFLNQTFKNIIKTILLLR